MSSARTLTNDGEVYVIGIAAENRDRVTYLPKVQEGRVGFRWEGYGKVQRKRMQMAVNPCPRVTSEMTLGSHFAKRRKGLQLIY